MVVRADLDLVDVGLECCPDSDRREVKWSYRIDKPLERTVIQPVPHSRRIDRLMVVDLFGEFDIETEEVDGFADRIDFGLIWPQLSR